MTITNTGRRVVLIGLVAIIAAMLPISAAQAAHLTGVTQLTADDEDGEGDNVDSAIAWSDPAGFPDGGLDDGARDPDYVLIGRDNIFPDNLASGALQGANGPLLLTDTDDLDDRVIQEISRLDVDRAIILGEFEAISEDVEDQLEELDLEVSRLGGITRIETAIEITQANASGNVDVDSDGNEQDDAETTTAILARAYDSDGGSSSQAFADSLAAGGWAAEEGYGVLLTESDTLTENTREYLESGEIDNVIIVGGEDAISEDVEDEVSDLDVDVRRVGGENRAETAADIAEERDVEGCDTILVEGYMENSWASGFPAAATSALEGYPILLSNGEGLPPETEDYGDACDDDDNGTDPDTGTDTDTDTDTGEAPDLVCGPLMPGAGEDDDDDNVTQDLAPACEEYANIIDADQDSGFGIDQSDDGTGVITEIDTDANTFSFTEDDPTTGESVTNTVEYDDDDDFTVNGDDADVEEFEDTAMVGDEVTVTTGRDNREIELTSADEGGLPPLPVG